MDDLEGCGTIIAIVGFIASVIGIFVFVTGIVSIPDWRGQRSHPTPTLAVVSTGFPRAPVSRKFDCVELDESPVQRGLADFLTQVGVSSALLVEPDISISDPDGLGLDIDVVRRSSEEDYYDVLSGRIRLVQQQGTDSLNWQNISSVQAAARRYDVEAVIFTEITGKVEKGTLFNTFTAHWISRVSLASTGEVIWTGHCDLEESK